MGAIVTLLTDFGTADGYVAEVKGVILAIAPDATIVDAAHDIPPQDIDAGRLALARYWRRFPPGTVHLAVVDPGVGSSRAAIAVASESRFCVGPDNGILSPALLAGGGESKVVALPIPEGAAPTFHARDVFAPAAARLASGASIDSLGPPHEHPVIRRTPEAHRRPDGAIEGEVILIDRFGNAITNLRSQHGGAVEILGRSLAVRRTYETIDAGGVCAIAGSSGFVEIAVRDGSAARTMGIARGTPAVLFPERS
jgi:S-adenosylmethionine hydrolase